MSAPRISPIERFLGPAEASGGPFALLALPVEHVDDDAILVALDRQVDRVNAHVERDTPEADEVRLALHAAAAQLLDPVVRRHLLLRWSATRPTAAPPAELPRTERIVPPPPAVRTALVSPPAPAVTDFVDAEHERAIRQLERDALLILSTGRGFDARARTRLLSLAHARGLDDRDVIAALSAIGSAPRPMPRNLGAREHQRASGLSATLGPPQRHAAAPIADRTALSVPPQTRSEQHDDHIGAPPRPHTSSALIAALGLGAVGLVGIVILSVAILSRRAPVAPVAGVDQSTVTQAASSAPFAQDAPVSPAAKPTPARSSAGLTPPVSAEPPPPPDPNDLLAITRDLGKASELLDADASGAMQLFESGITRLSTSWPRLVTDQLIAAVDAVVEFVYKSAGAPGFSDRIGQLVLAPADSISASGPVVPSSVVPAVWSAAMAARLSQERDLPATVLTMLQARRTASTWRTSSGREAFQGGMIAAMTAWPLRMSAATESGQMAGSPEAWRLWAEAVDMKSIDDRPAQTRMLLGGLETLLTMGPEADQNPTVGAVAADLVARLGWRSDDGSREWLLRAFDDPRLTVLDLRTLTTALSTRSRAEGVDATMVLSTGADQADRAALRERYATVWGIAQRMSRGEASETITRAAGEALARPMPTSDPERMAQLVRLAWINAAAAWIARGDAEAAATMLDGLESSISTALTPPQQGTPRDPSLSDGAFAERYLGARSNTKLKRDLLVQIDTPGQRFGPIDAEVIVSEAVSGQGDLSGLAQAIVRRHPDDPNIVNALLERLPRIPKSPQMSSLIEGVTSRKLPPPKDPAWDIAARRALVEAVIDRVATMGDNGSIDRLTRKVASAYRDLAATTPTPPQGGLDPGPASEAAAEAFRVLRWRADRVTPLPPLVVGLDRIDRGRQARLAQARGPLQVFAAEQVGVLELLIHATQAEHPAQSDRLREVLRDVGVQRRRATHILDQLIETEAAMTRVWLMRLGGGQPG